MQIRFERSSDFTSVDSLVYLAFNSSSEVKLAQELRKIQSTISFVASVDDKIVGQIMFSEIVIENDSINTNALLLSPMSVLPSYQRKGIGSALIKYGINFCKSTAYPLIAVLGHKDYYPKFGFKQGMDYRIHPLFDVRPEYWMIYELQQNAADEIQGQVKFPPPFDHV